jgi:hypothetical protein
MFLNQDEGTISDHTSRTMGTFFHVLLSGLIVQWLIDPESAISAKDLTEALRSTAAKLQANRALPRSKRVPKQKEKRR